LERITDVILVLPPHGQQPDPQGELGEIAPAGGALEAVPTQLVGSGFEFQPAGDLHLQALHPQVGQGPFLLVGGDLL
jgi:hypothetical protein